MSANEKPTVLFVDDEAQIVNLLKIMFRADYEVYSATSGAAALDIIQSRKVDVIVSDQRMPGMTGTELLAKVRRLSPGTMRILLTGYSDLAAMVGSINEGEIFRFVSKPWNKEEIRAIVKDAAAAARDTAASPQLAEEEPEQVEAGPMGGILVLDEDLAHSGWFQEHFGTSFAVHQASRIDQALDVLEQHQVGVVVTDTRVGGENTLDLLRILKQQHPQVMTVMLTSQADADAVMKLINQAQVCRLSFKPIKRGALDLAIRAAMMHHRRMLADPKLAQRQRVAAAPAGESSLTRSLASRLRALGGRLRLGFGS
ncbi:MAG: response regulator [Rhodocyclaceae bacterium]|nr:response regulator [Rhodocyclaceae bacterium]